MIKADVTVGIGTWDINIGVIGGILLATFIVGVVLFNLK